MWSENVHGSASKAGAKRMQLLQVTYFMSREMSKLLQFPIIIGLISTKQSLLSLSYLMNKTNTNINDLFQ